MATARQIAANRANAKFSTGPRSVNGKRKSSQNARTHGLCARLKAHKVKGFLEAMAEPSWHGHNLHGATATTATLLLAEAEANLARVRRIEADHSIELAELIEQLPHGTECGENNQASRALALLQDLGAHADLPEAAIADLAQAIIRAPAGSTSQALAQSIEKSERLQRYRHEAETLRHKRLRKHIESLNPETNPISSLSCVLPE